MSDYLITQIEATPNVEVRLRTRVVDGRGEDRLETLTLEDVGTGQREEVAAAAVFVLIGAEPRTEWLRDVVQRDDRGFILTGRDVPAAGLAAGASAAAIRDQHARRLRRGRRAAWLGQARGRRRSARARWRSARSISTWPKSLQLRERVEFGFITGIISLGLLYSILDTETSTP